VEQPSPQRFRLSTDQRMKLIERNFTLSLKDHLEVANRPVYEIYLKAKNKVVGDRILSIDKEKGVILQSILKESPTRSFVLLGTRSVNFKVPEKLDEFKLPSGSTVKQVKKWGPVNLSSFRNAEQKLGFAPRVPATVPFGFDITHKHVVGQEMKPILAYRLTDGMNTVTVFQWNPKKFDGESPFENVKTTPDTFGIRYYAEGDAPKAVLDEVRRTFVLR
jgi:hypothetical protein